MGCRASQVREVTPELKARLVRAEDLIGRMAAVILDLAHPAWGSQHCAFFQHQ